MHFLCGTWTQSCVQLMLQLMRFLCACVRVCVYQFTASLHTVQENQNGNHENQHPAAVAKAAATAASGKCKVNFVEGHASSRTEQELPLAISWQPYRTLLPPFCYWFSCICIYNALSVCVCVCRHFVRIVWPDVTFRIAFSILRSSCCCCIVSRVQSSVYGIGL